MNQIFDLHVQEDGRWSPFAVGNMYDQDESVTIILPHRVSLLINRFGNLVNLAVDLGRSSSDDDYLDICQIDLNSPDYRQTIKYNQKVFSRLRPAEKCLPLADFLINKAKYRTDPLTYLGRDWVDQVYLKFNPRAFADKDMNNLSCDLFRQTRPYVSGYNDTIDDDHYQSLRLKQPIFHLSLSLKLANQPAHYFFFIRWLGGNFLVYEKNFFFNENFFTK